MFCLKNICLKVVSSSVVLLLSNFYYKTQKKPTQNMIVCKLVVQLNVSCL